MIHKTFTENIEKGVGFHARYHVHVAYSYCNYISWAQLSKCKRGLLRSEEKLAKHRKLVTTNEASCYT